MTTINEAFSSGQLVWISHAKFAAQDNSGIVNFFSDRPKLVRSKWDTNSMEWIGVGVGTGVRMPKLFSDWDTVIASNESDAEIYERTVAAPARIAEATRIGYERDHYYNQLALQSEMNFQETMK